MSLFKPESMAVAEIIEKLQEAVDLGDSPHRGPFGTFIRKEYLVEAIEMLKTHPDIQPNEPLSLEELRAMHGKPVWIHRSEDGQGWWSVVRIGDTRLYTDYGAWCDLRDYGETWVVYRRPPKEDCHGLF